MGKLIVLISSIITSLLWFFLKSNSILIDPLLSISQLLALNGIVLISWSLLLSTKLKFVENLFNGLDKSYNVHRLIGSTAFIAIINHPLLLMLRSLPSAKSALIYLIPTGTLAYTLGILALYSMITSFIFIVFIKLPYHIWKLTHKVLGASFMLGALHSLLIGSDIANFFILKSWIIFFIILGSTSAFYILFMYRKFSQKLDYVVDKIERKLDIFDIYLRPINNKLNFYPGQFVYLSVTHNQTLSQELHPFSLSSSPQGRDLRLSVKISGDYTLKLPKLKIGDQIKIYGPHGTFAQTKELHQNEVWIAGGIGVTPFLSILSSLKNSPLNYYFYYCVKNKKEAVFSDEIKKIISNIPNFKFIEWFSETKGRIEISKIKDQVDNFTDTNFLICGPVSMMNNLKDQLIKLNIKQKQINFENFSLD